MGHCNDGELESCQVPFPDVPVLGTKTCQNSFSEPEDEGEGTACVHGASLILLHFPSLVHSAVENFSPAPHPPAPPGHGPGRGTTPHGPRSHLGLGTNARQCSIKLLLNLFSLFLWAWRSSQQPPVWANVG